MAEWTIEIPGRPATLNRERKGSSHWTQTREETRAVREAAFWLVKEAKIPRLDRVAITVTPFLRDGRTQDVGACFPTAKAVIDSLVDAKVLADDGPKYVVSLLFLAPICRAGRDALRVRVLDVSEEADE